jgi:hypothetical protein
MKVLAIFATRGISALRLGAEDRTESFVPSVRLTEPDKTFLEGPIIQEPDI